MSKILVTGGAGFIGSRLAHDLILKGYEVVLVDNMSYGNVDNYIFDDMNIEEVCKVYYEDVSDFDTMNRIFRKEQFDYVYHIAGIAPLPDCQLNKTRCIESNVVGVNNILECARLYGVKRVMFSATNAIYENVPHEHFPVKETEKVETTLLYPTSKLMAEELCKSFNRTYNLPITVFRFSNVYGPGMDIMRKYPPVTGAFIKALYYGETPTIYADGEQKRDFIYVKDLLSLIEMPLERDDFPLYDVINVSSSKQYSVKEQYDIIAKAMHKEDVVPQYVEEKDFWKKMPEIYNGAYKIKEEILVREVNKNTFSDNTHARELGWRPRYTFEEGLTETVNEMIKILEAKK